MSKKILIYYPPGTYGHFIEFLIKWIDSNDNDSLLSDYGSFHNQSIEDYQRDTSDWRNAVRATPFTDIINKRLSYYTSTQHFILQAHPPVNLEQLQDKFDHIIVMRFDLNDYLWVKNNYLTKLDPDEINNFLKDVWGDKYNDLIGSVNFNISVDEKLQEELSWDGADYTRWNCNSMNEMKRWQLREMLSLRQLKPQQQTTITNNNVNVIEINIKELVNNFNQVLNVLSFDQPISRSQSEIDQLYQQWISKQYYIDIGTKVDQWVDDIINRRSTKFTNMTLLIEAEIQKRLRQQGWEIECYDLDQWPDTTDQLRIHST